MNYRTSYRNRACGISIAIAPVILGIASILAPWATDFRALATKVGFIGIAIVAINAWTTVLQPVLWRAFHRNMEDYRHSSVLPLIGTFVGIATCLIGFGHTTPALIAIAVFIFDFGGSFSFILSTWRDQSFWDLPEQKEGEQGGDGDAEEAV